MSPATHNRWECLKVNGHSPVSLAALHDQMVVVISVDVGQLSALSVAKLIRTVIDLTLWNFVK